MFSIESLNKLQEWFAKLPGIGPKSAARLAYHVIEMDPERSSSLPRICIRPVWR